MQSSDLVSLAKKVIRKAGEIGLEEGGKFVCGPAWPFVEKILSPVVEELEHRFPKLFLVPEETEKASEALSEDVALQEMLQKGFAQLESGQEEILAALARQNEVLVAIGEAVNRGFQEGGQKIDNSFENIRQQLEEIRFLIAPVSKVTTPFQSGLSISEINERVYAFQSDAMKWVEAGHADIASQRLAEARILFEDGLKRDPHNTYLLVACGYIEKTQAQVGQLQGDHEMYVNSLAEAAKYFAQVLSINAKDIGALNGMANIYLFDKDYDRAIQLSTLAVHCAPNYGAASWDLAIALENKLAEAGPEPELIDRLKTVYRRIEFMMPQQPEAFTASNLAHVQKRLRVLSSS